MIEVEYREVPTPGEIRTTVRILAGVLWSERAAWFFFGAAAACALGFL